MAKPCQGPNPDFSTSSNCIGLSVAAPILQFSQCSMYMKIFWPYWTRHKTPHNKGPTSHFSLASRHPPYNQTYKAVTRTYNSHSLRQEELRATQTGNVLLNGVRRCRQRAAGRLSGPDGAPRARGDTVISPKIQYVNRTPIRDSQEIRQDLSGLVVTNEGSDGNPTKPNMARRDPTRPQR